LSAYESQSSMLRDEECLVKALCENGFTRDQIEVHETPQNLIDYHGQNRGQKATVIIRRKFVGPVANDIGFAMKSDGTYEVFISDYDRHKHGPQWVTELTKSYDEHVLIKQGAIMGYVYLGTKVDEFTGLKKVQFAVQG
jgi:uncharacterized protein DUF1257